MAKRETKEMTASVKVLCIDAIREALWACEGKEYDPDRFGSATVKCRAALKALGVKDDNGRDRKTTGNG